MKRDASINRAAVQLLTEPVRPITKGCWLCTAAGELAETEDAAVGCAPSPFMWGVI